MIAVMDATALARRKEFLRGSQNADGGWGYFPRKRSWLEPTYYAALALGGPEEARAWECVRHWRGSDKGWRPSAAVAISNWTTALAVAWACARGETGEPFASGVEWLLGTRGEENAFRNRLAARTGLVDPGRNVELTGWPWLRGTTSWVEPTAHALIALKRAAAKVPSPTLKSRIETGEKQLLDVRCSDGGWNYGGPRALKIDLPSYPETTALALLGLQGHNHAAMQPALDFARGYQERSRMAAAWLTIALRNWGMESQAEIAPELPAGGDILVTALEVIALTKPEVLKPA